MSAAEMPDRGAEIEALARRIAENAHAGQTDKAGEPYIGHVRRVAERLDDPLDRAVAWLHDVVEDTEWTAAGLLALDVEVSPGGKQDWASVVHDVMLLTHRPHQSRGEYYAGLRARGRRVKLADVADNSDPSRLAVLDPATRERLVRKYAKARQALGA